MWFLPVNSLISICSSLSFFAIFIISFPEATINFSRSSLLPRCLNHEQEEHPFSGSDALRLNDMLV
jgi:hypothetical protein